MAGIAVQPGTGEKEAGAPRVAWTGDADPDPGAGDKLAELGQVLIDLGVVDQRSLARAQRVAEETHSRLDRVLTQLGIVSERGLAEAMAELFGVPLAMPGDYPPTPLFEDRLRPKFLRKAQALPVSDGETG